MPAEDRDPRITDTERLDFLNREFCCFDFSIGPDWSRSAFTSFGAHAFPPFRRDIRVAIDEAIAEQKYMLKWREDHRAD